MIYQFDGQTLQFTNLEVGDSFIRHGQQYHCVDIEPYINRQGEPSGVATWHTECAQCEEPFTVKTSARTIRSTNTRCLKHRQPRVPSSPSARLAKKTRGRS